MFIATTLTEQTEADNWCPQQEHSVLLRNRRFQLWEYRVGHGCLLVRSPNDENHPTNVDVICEGVLYMELPRFIPDLRLDSPTDEEILHAKGRIMGHKCKNERVRIFTVSGARFTVVSLTINVREHRDGWLHSPFNSPVTDHSYQ
jgi:hypothetical protein